jgi:ceramide glucosyltransferase
MNPLSPLDGLRLLLGLSLAAFIAYTLISIWAARKWRQVKPPLDPAWTPPVSILKPVRGLDAEAYDNFVSFCHLDYPPDHMQLIFGALDATDPALTLARRLQSEFPNRDIQVICGGPEALRGHNLKICNLISMLPAAKHDLIVLCDSDMRVQPDYLRRLVAPFQRNAQNPQMPQVNTDDSAVNSQLSTRGTPAATQIQNPKSKIQKPVGLVTCPYRCMHVYSFAAVLEALGIGADFIPSALVSRALEGVSFAFGPTIALPRAVLEQIGGFEALLDQLADDFRLGDGARRAGYTVVLSDYMVDDVLGRERFDAMWARRLRWARTVRSCRPAGYAGAFVTYGVPLALLFVLAMGGNKVGWLTLAGTIALRCAAALLIAITCTGDTAVQRWWPLLPVSDLFSFALYLGSYLGNHITWRGEHFRLLSGGRLEYLHAPDKPTP